LQSSNEELQSTNEELETSKEELQSVNEELSTVNSELQQIMEELSKTSSDLNNLLSSTEIGTIFLDTRLNIRFFTHAANEFFSLLQTDIGRPVSHLASNMRYDGLVEDAKEVLKRLVPKEMEVETKQGRWFNMRILPFRTIDNRIDGVVITFVEITQRREMEEKLRQEMGERERAQQKVQRALEYADGIVNTMREPLVVLDANLRVVSANRSFYRTFRVIPEETLGSLLYDLGNRQWDIPKLRELLEELLPHKTEVIDYEVDHVFSKIGHKMMVLNARQIAGKEGEEDKKLILLAIEDCTILTQGENWR
jgi:two-component system CheB/CheR fusion protein